jgi:succinyl-diaminopimelate desuccinylase
MSDSDVVELTCDLIRRASVTPEDLGCQDLIAARLQAAGFGVERLRFGAVDNLWATLGEPGPTFAFLGHTDVVPSGPANTWTSPPFEPTVDGDLLRGRGAADMKGSVAAMVVALEQMAANRTAWHGRVGLLLTSDEEGDAIDGVRKVAELFRTRGERIDWCLVGEPSSAQVLGDVVRIGRRGSLTATVDVRGIQGHVAYPDKALNPIHRVLPVLLELCARDWDDEPWPDFPATSFQIANFNAGTGASNVIPGQARVQFNLRYSPRWNADALITDIEATFERQGVQAEFHWHRSGEPFHSADGPLRRAVRAELAETLGILPDENTGGGTSDGRFIAPLGAQVVELGPLNASIHKIDEVVSVRDLVRLPGLYAGIARRCLAEPVVSGSC